MFVGGGTQNGDMIAQRGTQDREYSFSGVKDAERKMSQGELEGMLCTIKKTLLKAQRSIEYEKKRVIREKVKVNLFSDIPSGCNPIRTFQ